MTKVLILLGALAVILAVGGFFLTMRSGNETASNQSNNTASKLNINPNQPIICEYSTDDGASTAYILEDKARINSSQSGENFAVIATSDTSYFWNVDTKDGWSYDINDIDNQEDSFDIPTREELDNQIEDNTADCRNESFDTSLLTPPSDVTFTNFENQLSDQLENLPEDIQEQIPQDVKDQIPEEYQDYLQ